MNNDNAEQKSAESSTESSPASQSTAPAPTFGARFLWRLKIWIAVLVGFVVFSALWVLVMSRPAMLQDDPLYSEQFGPGGSVLDEATFETTVIDGETLMTRHVETRWSLILVLAIPLVIIFVVDMIQQVFRGNTRRAFKLATIEIACLILIPLTLAFWFGLLPVKSADQMRAEETKDRLGLLSTKVTEFKADHGRLPNFTAPYYSRDMDDEDFFVNVPVNPQTRSGVIVVSDVDPANEKYGWYWSSKEQKMYAVFLSREWLDSNQGQPWTNNGEPDEGKQEQ